MSDNDLDIGMDFDFDPEAMQSADKNAERITDSGPYVGEFTAASFLKTDKGAKGIEFEFKSATGGQAGFIVYTHGKDGKPTFGYDQVQALIFLLGLKGLKGQKGKVMAWADGEDGKRERAEVDGIVYPDLCGKSIGIVLQKELTSKQNGGDSFRWNLYGQFNPVSRLTATEIKNRVADGKGTKLEKMLKGLKDKDNRKAKSAEPSQPSMGVPEGDY